jgi:hypothetical protein
LFIFGGAACSQSDLNSGKNLVTGFDHIPLAVGVAAVVLSILWSADNGTLISLLGIGLFSKGLDALNRG